MTRALAVLLALAPVTARALDCSTVAIAIGQPLTPDAAECLRRAVVACEHGSSVCEARLVEARAQVAACEATSAIACPPPEVPVVPYLAGVATGVVFAIVAAVFLWTR